MNTLKKYQRIVAIGCSYTYGAEALEENVTDEACLTVAWPQVLGNMLECPVVNLAVNGASNDYIYYALTNWMLRNADLIKDSLIIVQWSFITRVLAFKSDDASYYCDLNPRSLDLDDRHLTPITNQSIWPKHFWPRGLTRTYVDYLATDPRNMLNCATNSVVLKHALASMGAQFEYFSVQPLYRQFDRAISGDFTAVLEPYYAYSMIQPGFEWIWDMEHRTPGGGRSGGHFNAAAHLWWAGKVYNYLDTGIQIK
jgi:hypothetical protein